MQYLLKSGMLIQKGHCAVLAQLKRSFKGTCKKICNEAGEVVLEASIGCIDDKRTSAGDVRNHEYRLTDERCNIVASAYPEYAQGEEPEVQGWPICRMPRVDHARVRIRDCEYLLTLHSGQQYRMNQFSNVEVLRITHQGLTGGWLLEDFVGFPPSVLCGLFVFCRYIEQENEFLIV